MVSRYAFLVETFETEILKVLSVWSMAVEADLDERPLLGDRRGRTLREHMVHQCQSEHGWFAKMFGIKAPLGALPEDTTKVAFLRHYAEVAQYRLAQLAERDDAWWEMRAPFFELSRPRTWIMMRRIAHTAHHRGQQTAMLRARGSRLHSTYGPTADTGGLAKDQPPVIYPYEGVSELLQGELDGGRKQTLPDLVMRAVTELPGA